MSRGLENRQVGALQSSVTMCLGDIGLLISILQYAKIFWKLRTVYSSQTAIRIHMTAL